jgi:hypothetical protein
MMGQNADDLPPATSLFSPDLSCPFLGVALDARGHKPPTIPLVMALESQMTRANAGPAAW